MSDALQVQQLRGTHGFAPPSSRLAPMNGHARESGNGPRPVNGFDGSGRLDASSPEPPVLAVRVGTPLAEIERRMILATLEQHGGNKRRAAQVLGISVRTIYNRLRDYRFSSR